MSSTGRNPVSAAMPSDKANSESANSTARDAAKGSEIVVPRTKILRATLRQNNRQYKVKWEFGEEPKPREGQSDHVWALEREQGTGWGAYKISIDKLKRQTHVVRERLEEFAARYFQEDKDAQAQIDAMERVVEAGIELYNVLLTPDGGDDQGFRAWFESEIARVNEPKPRADVVLEIVLDDSGPAFVPAVGMIFTPRTSRVRPSKLDFDAYTDFWAVAFRCACFPVPHRKERTEMVDHKHFETLVVRENADSTYDLIQRKITAQKLAPASIISGHRVVSGGNQLKEKIINASLDKCVLFHFDLQADAKHEALPLLMDANDLSNRPFTAQDLTDATNRAEVEYRGRLDQRPFQVDDKTYAVAVIDREAIIRGDRGENWLRKGFFQQPWIGLIATECDLKSETRRDLSEIPPERFLGMLLLRSIFKQESRRLVDAIVDARRECWPFSIFFGLYCNPRQPWIKGTPVLVKEVDLIIPILGASHPGSKLQFGVGKN